MPNRCISLLPGLILCVFREYKSQLLETVLTLMESISLNQLMLFWKTAKLEQVLTLSFFFSFVKIPYLSLSHLFVVRTRIEMKLKSDCGANIQGMIASQLSMLALLSRWRQSIVDQDMESGTILIWHYPIMVLQSHYLKRTLQKWKIVFAL